MSLECSFRAGLIPACAGKTCRVARVPRRTGAHPRVCGENSVPGLARERGFGSSPRVRGKPRPPRERPQRPGLIPACAGKTPLSGAMRYTSQAHPRVCGENFTFRVPDLRGRGSSPRVRGKPTKDGTTAAYQRLIPACAGKTTRAPCKNSGSPAHPRVCGENPRHRRAALLRGSSSPRVRGKRIAGGPHAPARGLIPACAGKTHVCFTVQHHHRAHPRVCGENQLHEWSASSHRGSSPRVRGKPVQHLHGGAWHGLIPACAGKTSRRRSLLRPSPAHPRVCGENLGSAPRASAPAWLIPACAGKTSYGCRPAACLSAHPRVCGENYWVPASRMRKLGSSPRVRGKLGVGEAHGGVDGLIPACAGKT